MKKQNSQNNWLSSGAALISGIVGGIITVVFVTGNIPIQRLGTLADWVSGLGTVAALVFAYQEIKNSREQFEKEHSAELKVHTSWKDMACIEKDENKEVGNASIDLSGVLLHIVPINRGLATGIYRYLGVCRKVDLDDIFCLIEKIKNDSATVNEIDELAGLICFDEEDVGQSDRKHDMTGMSLIYPNDSKLFQSISSNHVGIIMDKSKSKIEKKLHVNISEDTLEVLYIDPSINLYSFEIKMYKG